MCKEEPPECVFSSSNEEMTLQDWAKGFDDYGEMIRKKRQPFAHRQADPDIKQIYDIYRQVVERWRNHAITESKDCPVLPDVPALIGNDYYTGMINLEDFCRRCAAKLRDKQAEPLSKNAEIVYDILDKLPPHKALTVPEILDRVSETHGKQWDEKELYDRVFPQLKQWGLKNKPRIGYWIVKQESVDAPS